MINPNTTTIHEYEDRVIIEGVEKEMWCLYDEVLEEWLVTNNAEDDTGKYHKERNSALKDALGKLDILE